MTLAEKIIQAKQERANINTQIRSIMDTHEGKEMDPTKKDELRKLEDDFDKRNADVIAWEKQLERDRITVEERDQKPVDEPGKRGQEQKPDTETQARDLFVGYLRSGTDHALEQYRALQQDNPSQAGYLVAPQRFVMDLIADLNNIIFMRQKAKILPALQGAQSLGYPKRTARMNSAAWGTELSAPTPDTQLQFGKKEFRPNPATAEILISKTLIRNAPGIDGIVRGEMAYDFAELLENAYMTGDGNGKPLGVFTASPDGISTDRDVSEDNTATDITFNGLKSARYSIKQQYWNNLEWIFHRDAVKKLAKIKDAEGQYIWQQSVVVGEPDRLLNSAVNMSEYAPNTFTSGKYVGLLGNLQNYWIVDSLQLEIMVLMELYARTNQVDYVGRIETDGMPVAEEAFARVKLG